jgi:GxxExxY protein
MYTENELSYLIRGAAFKLHSRLGPGLLESVYETSLEYELRKLNLEVKSQVGIPMSYDSILFLLINPSLELSTIYNLHL